LSIDWLDLVAFTVVLEKAASCLYTRFLQPKQRIKAVAWNRPHSVDGRWRRCWHGGGVEVWRMTGGSTSQTLRMIC